MFNSTTEVKSSTSRLQSLSTAIDPERLPMIWAESHRFPPLRIQAQDPDQLRKTPDSKTRLKNYYSLIGRWLLPWWWLAGGRSHPGPCNWLSGRSLFGDLARSATSKLEAGPSLSHHAPSRTSCSKELVREKAQRRNRLNCKLPPLVAINTFLCRPAVIQPQSPKVRGSKMVSAICRWFE
jgi:hypothetical protein